MKKFLCTLIATLTLMTGCNTPTSSTLNSSNIQISNIEEYEIGIIQLMEHTALDDARKGFTDGLAELGINAKINVQNAQGDTSNCVTIATNFSATKPDLILAIATPAAQAAANAIKDIPILVTAITDPASSRLVKSNEKPDTNVSGTSDMSPIKEQISLIKELVPNAKKIGLMHCSSEDNSIMQIEIAKKEIESLGMEYIVSSVSTPNEIVQVTQNLAGKVDAIYIPTDNMLSSGMSAITKVTEQAKIPVIGADILMVDNGATAAKGLSYYELGKQTAHQAYRILKEGADISQMPVEYLQKTDLRINQEMANKIGLQIPESLISQTK